MSQTGPHLIDSFITYLVWLTIYSLYHKPISAVTSKRGRSSLSGKNPFSCFGRIILKTQNLNCRCAMLLVFGASRSISFNDDNHILKFFTEVLKIYCQVFFLIPKICYRVLSSARGYIYTSCSGSFI